MNELLKEIEDDIRQERLDRLWHHLGKIMIAASAAVVLVTVAVVVVQNHRQSVAMEQTGHFIAGLDRLDLGDYRGAIADFSQLTGNESSPYYGLAMLRTAQAESAGGDKEGAEKTYKTLAAHNEAFGELAQMHGADIAALPDRHSPFYYTQSEWSGWQKLRAGKKDEAITQFLALRDDAEAPYSIRQRMQDAVQQLAPEKNDVSMTR